MNWSEDLFLKINDKIGEKEWLDKIMMFCAHNLLFVLVFLAFLWATTVLAESGVDNLKRFFKIILTAGAFAYLFSWAWAFISPKNRPSEKYPEIKQLLNPLSTWKTFPSDHTIAAFIIMLSTVLMGAPLWFGFILLLFALLVGAGRVYVGVHYPKDVLGGILVAAFFVLISPWLLDNITQPIYKVFKQLFL
ncbi:MAG: phosphatase PAP2 family protein [Candidatus Magasanikbacteria bacterium]